MKTNQDEYQNKTHYQNKKFDAREKGSNQYTGDGGSRRKKDEKSDDKQKLRGTSGFDIRI